MFRGLDADNGQQFMDQYSHRVMSLVAGLLVLTAAYLAWRRFRAQRWLTNWLTFAVGFLITQVLLGALIATGAIPQAGGWTTAIHLGLSLLALAVVLGATVVVYHSPEQRDWHGVSFPIRPPLTVAFIALFV